MKKAVYIKVMLGLTVVSLAACVGEKKEDRNVESINTHITQKANNREKVKRIKKIFFALPSPLELTLLFKKENVAYHADKLHNTSKRKQYELTKQKALNLGIYGADLSYSGLFGRHQSAIEYFAASQMLAEDLGIGRTFQSKFVSRLEENAANRDTLLQVVSDFFLENDSYLKDHDQQDISTYVLTGGWIEGLYLGTQMIDENTDAVGIKEIISNQKNSLRNVILLLQNLNDKEGVEDLIDEIGMLEMYYGEIEDAKVVSSSEENSEGVLRISDNANKVEMSDETFIKIKDKVAVIRNRIIQ